MATAALVPLGLLFIADGPTSYIALVGVVATLAAGLVGRWLDGRKDDKRHAWELQERLAAAATIREELLGHRTELVGAIKVQTAAATAQVENARSTLSRENTGVAEQVKAIDETVQQIKDKQIAGEIVPTELTTRVAIGKLLHELFNGLHAEGLSEASESRAFQLGNQARIKELAQVLTSSAL